MIATYIEYNSRESFRLDRMQTVETTLKLAAALGGVVAFCWSVWQYLDVRRKERQERRLDQFHRAFVWVAGRTEAGVVLVDTQQAMAVYELAAFPEFRHLSLPILDYYLKMTNTEPDDSLFRAALLTTVAHLRKER